ncbi:MAG: hypothetical protein GX605_11170 [Chloroflexi bacterium]|nr:hypothetical protein [Chloroflexota bacterium]
MPESESDRNAGLWATLREGMLMGVVADGIAAPLVWPVLWSVIRLEGLATGASFPTGESLLLQVAMYFASTLFIVFPMALLPAVLAGAADALILRRAMAHGRKGTRIGPLAGAAIGLATGVLVSAGGLLVLYAPEPPRSLEETFPGFVVALAGGVVGALGGAWHGRHMARWLRRGPGAP